MLVDDFAPPQLFQVDDKPITLVEGWRGQYQNHPNS